MELSKYQLAVNEHFARMGGHSAVVSVAGSGKTTTALRAIAELPYGTSTLLGAFNVSIRDEFKQKGQTAGLKNVTYANFNGFGWGICSRNLRVMPELDKDKTANVFEFVVFRPDTTNEQSMRTFKLWRGPIEKLVSLFKSLAIHTPEMAADRMLDIVEHYNLDVPDSEKFDLCVIDTFKACIEHQAHYDFDDQKYMPMHFGWPVPVFDQVVVDEFQDVCPIELDLMRAATGCDGQFCAIGDPDQTIYGFKGATPDIFPEFILSMRARELPLSICYRCPIDVVREAQKIVPRIEWAPGAAQGVVDSVREKWFYEQVRDKDFVLCRTTDELVSKQIELTRQGRKSKVRGRDFCNSLGAIIGKVSNYNNQMPVQEFITALLDYQIARAEQLTKLRREREVITLEDRCQSIRAIAENACRVIDIHERMKEVFTDTEHDGIDLLSIHRSKGLQAKRVWVLRPDLLPHPRSSEREWMLAEERRLKYVAVTRAEESLFWVEG